MAKIFWKLRVSLAMRGPGVSDGRTRGGNRVSFWEEEEEEEGSSDEGSLAGRR